MLGKKKKEKKTKTPLESFKSLLWFVALFFFIRGSIFEAFKIPSESMLPTLLVGDHLLVSKLDYGLRLPFVTRTLYNYSSPSRGDIVVFTRPDEPQTLLEDESSINLIKRVVGLPGDRIEVRGTKVFIDGEELEEQYADWGTGSTTPDFGPVTIPDGTVVVIGDNRNNSRDSRVWSYHFLEIDRVMGKAYIIYWNFNSPERILDLIE